MYNTATGPQNNPAPTGDTSLYFTQWSEEMKVLRNTTGRTDNCLLCKLGSG